MNARMVCSQHSRIFSPVYGWQIIERPNIFWEMVKHGSTVAQHVTCDYCKEDEYAFLQGVNLDELRYFMQNK